MNCDDCNTQLEWVGNEGRRKDDFPQYKDALVIEFKGGYGMYYDGPSVRRIYCKDCANIFMDSLPYEIVLE